ncbi:MAG: hypothetical protein M3488_04510, partial [Actinomycetota bacterium]|nr:hypothetical protein [Actinomycetota bacterium]
MAKAIVDGLEVVEVERQQRHWGVVAPPAGKRVVDSIAQQQPIRQAGERVVHRLVAESRLRLPALCDV